jgi:bile acid:Na+ symporter, BASS family
MTETLTMWLSVTVVIYMIGNLMDLGFNLDVRKAMAGLRDVRFVTLSLLWAFVLCPALAYAIGVLLPLPPPYAMGLLLLGLAPCAPLLPGMVEKAHGDVNYAATFILLISAVTIVFMPIAVPLLVKGVAVSAWTVAKPMLFLVMVPLVIGVVVQLKKPSIASALHPWVKKVTGVDTLLMLLLVIAIYSKGFIGAIGTWAVLAQALFFAVTIVASYALAIGVPPSRKSVISLGLSTRNVGAALAPLFAARGIAPPEATVMVCLGIPAFFIFSIVAARVFASRAAKTKAASTAGRP